MSAPKPCPECGGKKWAEAEVETVEGGTEVVSYICQSCGHDKSWLACCTDETGGFEMCGWHRREWDLRADLEEWRAAKFWIAAWRAQAEWIGVGPLNDVMCFAHIEVNARIATLEAEHAATMAEVVQFPEGGAS